VQWGCSIEQEYATYLSLLVELSSTLLALLLLRLALLKESLWDEDVVLGWYASVIQVRTVGLQICTPSRELLHSGILNWRYVLDIDIFNR
jgi:hypothetical protein